MIRAAGYKKRILYEHQKLKVFSFHKRSQKPIDRADLFTTHSSPGARDSFIFPQETMQRLGLFSLVRCFNGCRDHSQVSGLGTRIWNLSDKPVELQIRVGSILKRVHTLKPGSSKRLKCKTIYKAFMPGGAGSGSGGNGGGMRNLLYYYDETCHPYIWIHDSVGHCSRSRMVKQQFISLEDLKNCSEIRIFRDHQRGCISVRKKPRPDFC